MIENAQGIYNAPSVYNQGGGGGGGLQPLPPGFEKILYIENAGVVNKNPRINLSVNLLDSKDNLMSDTIKFTLYTPNMDLSQAGSRRFSIIQRSYNNEIETGFALYFDLNIKEMNITLRGYHSNSLYPTWNDVNLPNFGFPEYANVTLSRNVETGKFIDNVNGVEYVLSGNTPITSNDQCALTLFHESNNANIKYFKGVRIFGLDIYDAFTGNLKQKFEPVKNNDDGSVGLYERVQGYYTSASLGSIIAGPVVV